MRLNPIVKKDIKVQARSMRICWGVFAYELILALVFFLAMSMIQQERRYTDGNLYASMVWLYPVLGVTQLVILGVVVPVRTASSISGEKERQTFDIMMTTGMTPFSVIMGKVMTAVVQSMLFVVASMPVMALPFIIGGMSWSYLLWFLLVAVLVSFFTASIGIFCSSFCKRTISAVILSFGFYVVFFLGTLLPFILSALFGMNSSYYSTTGYGVIENMYLFWLLNPAVYLCEFYARIMAGGSVMSELVSLTGTTQVHGPIRYVVTGNRWLILSTLLFLTVSFLLLWLAARRIDPIRKRVEKRGRKKVSDQGD
ncbi:MAG: ABC transporter permease [Lachnospiraceae bacterium]|jgi:ABC-2 type transport system permease protein|nr:ABC transporter permease [Lachnospiraceae bacterium]